MNRLFFAVGLSVASFAVSAYDGNLLYQWARANERVAAGTATGTEPMDSGVFMGFVIGISNYMAASGVICFPKNAQNQQALDVVDNYLHTHPERRTDDAVFIVNDAMRATFPCKRG